MRAWRLALIALLLVGLAPYLLPDALAGKGGKPKPPPDSLTNPALTLVQADSKRSQVYVMSTDGTKRQTTSGRERIFRYTPTWSPDGSVIAFPQPAGHPVMDLYVVAPDGSGLSLVHTFGTAGAAVDRYAGLSWFPVVTRSLPASRSCGFVARPDCPLSPSQVRAHSLAAPQDRTCTRFHQAPRTESLAPLKVLGPQHVENSTDIARMSSLSTRLVAPLTDDGASSRDARSSFFGRGSRRPLLPRNERRDTPRRPTSYRRTSPS